MELKASAGVVIVAAILLLLVIQFLVVRWAVHSAIAEYTVSTIEYEDEIAVP